MNISLLLTILIATAAGGGVGYLVFTTKGESRLEKAEAEAKKLVSDAKKERQQIISKAEKDGQQYLERIEKHLENSKSTQQKKEAFIERLSERLKVREKDTKEKEEIVQQLREEIKEINTKTDELKQEFLPKLSKHVGEKMEAIRENMLQNLDEDLSLAREARLTRHIEAVTEDSPLIAKDLITLAIQRYSAPSSVERKNPLIPVKKNTTKAKIMGQNGENVAFLEEATGVNIIFDENRGGIIISHYLLVKKHIAIETVKKLINDPKVNLDQVKKRLAEAEKETQSLLIRIGDEVLKKLNLDYRKLPDAFKECVGRLKFRTSYGQNILKHSFEVGYFTLMLGSELGLNEEVCKIGGFLQDVGKAIDQEEGRPHDVLTKEIMEQYGFSWEEVHAAWTHHDSIPIETAEALVVKGTDAMSAGRPGARQETIEKYLERIKAIEGIARSYEGTKKAYAISGGRELRMLIDPEKLSDGDLKTMADDVANNVEANVAYPGQIKVNVIRRIEHKKTIKEKK